MIRVELLLADLSFVHLNFGFGFGFWFFFFNLDSVCVFRSPAEWEGVWGWLLGRPHNERIGV